MGIILDNQNNRIPGNTDSRSSSIASTFVRLLHDQRRRNDRRSGHRLSAVTTVPK